MNFNFKNMLLMGGAIIVIFMILFIGVFLLSNINTGITDNLESEVETFTVDDPTVDNEFNVGFTPRRLSVVVEKYDGSSWSTIASSHVSVSGKTVTVTSGGLLS